MAVPATASSMSTAPCELSLELRPSTRFDIVDLRRQSGWLNGLAEFPYALFWSFHTTAGFLEQRRALHLDTRRGGVRPYIRAFQTVFPQEAGYRHDELHLRDDLSNEQRQVEPRNGDAHLTFIASGLRTCVRYRNRPSEPVYFVDLDGVADDRHRRRQARVIGFHHEHVVARDQVLVPMSSRALDSVSLKHPDLGLYERLQALIDKHGVTKGRVRLALGAADAGTALTINEYETLLMRHDLASVLHDPFRFMAEKGRHMIADPWAIPAKAMDYAKYDVIRSFNQVCERLRIPDSRAERLISLLLGRQAHRFLRLQRSVNLLVSDAASPGRGRLVEGVYQCPILLQWMKTPGNLRTVGISLTRFE